MIISLTDSTIASSGAKAAGLGTLLRAGLPVPDGFVIPTAAYRAVADDLALPTLLAEHGPTAVRQELEARPLPQALISALTTALSELGEGPVAVRSSAADEDSSTASAAGQYDSFLAVVGPAAVAARVRATWASAWSPRAVAYQRTEGSLDRPEIAVVVQRHLDAEVAGVLFTNGREATVEASWGLGESVVQGLVTPDAYTVAADGTITSRLGDKQTRIDRGPAGTVSTPVPRDLRRHPCLTDPQLRKLQQLGHEVAGLFGGAQDIEFAVTGGEIWLLQARPVTAELPAAIPGVTASHPEELQGTPGSRGQATGTARLVHGPQDFHRVRPGDVLVCRYTDPAWTPLFTVIAGVATEQGGRLSHAAIVARERQIPAVLGVPNLMTAVQDGRHLTIDGTTGTVRQNGPSGR
ncbi:pyruvate phosphate dikinase PEP/pyruvate- binding protein [Kribbella flavida DSM 17836]|uniref:Pyruvate phosphate dikinase PEP/pyruvate-binding protein n=1 Tax=Kribbella flavida (strain DSM 17836 / JCM 10339 / NBRC 14399) TaxID=479435 RepID=D2Q1M0_KRIFD|nr:PEP/pyruvate-binding domain-containing protein [Kribbella flavida]ADB32009.1 pyruvate phosphate dikinase PEP/pyruvate- binding protein [Kribbella flavida DSM 17836]